MIACVTSMGEPTTDICIWALRRNGWDVKVYEGKSTLGQKLERIYNDLDEDFLRVDADVIVNRNCVLEPHKIETYAEQWWTQYTLYNWFKQDLSPGGVQLIQKECLPILRTHIPNHVNDERPETSMFRLREFFNPRRCETVPLVVGLNGFGIPDWEYVRNTKNRRGQTDYDWDIVDKLGTLWIK